MPRAMRRSQLRKTGNRRLPELIIDVLSPHHKHLNQRACGSTLHPPGPPLGTYCLWCILKVAVRRFAAPVDREKRNHRSSDALGNHPFPQPGAALALFYANTPALHLTHLLTPDQKEGVKMARNWPWSMALIYYHLLCKVIPVLYLAHQFTPDQKRGVKMARNWPWSIY